MNQYHRIIIILCLISSVTRFVLDSYLPSIPALREYFVINPIEVQSTLTLYLFGFGVSQLIYGPLSDVYGRRKILIIGLSIFLLGNILCSIATTKEMLFFARLLTGVGAGACGVLNRAIAADYFKGTTFAKAWSITSTSLVITLCLAPVIGGYIQEYWDWRGNFITSTVYVFIVLGMIIKYLPETNPEINLTQFNSRKILKDYQHVLANQTFIIGAVSYTLAFSGLIAYFQISPILFIENMHLTPSQYGWYSLIIATMYLFGGLIVNRYSEWVSTRKLLVFGIWLLILGGFLMFVAYQLHYVHIIAILIPASIFVIGARIVIPNAITNSMEEIQHLKGSSSALLGFIQMAGSGMISFVIAKFNHSTSLPLAVLFLIIGCTLLTITLTYSAEKYS